MTVPRLTSARGAATSRTMKIRDADILIIPGYRNSEPDHWQSRWQAKMATARRVEQAAFCQLWHRLDRADAVHLAHLADQVAGGVEVVDGQVDH